MTFGTMKKKTGFLAVFIMMIVVSVLMTGCGEKIPDDIPKHVPKEIHEKSEPVVLAFMKAIETGKGSEIIAYIPEYQKGDSFDEALAVEFFDGEYSSIKTDMESRIGEYDVVYQITEETDLTKEELSGLKEGIKSSYPDYDTGRITKGRILTVDVTLEGENGSEEDTLTFNLILEDGKWKKA